MSEIKDKLREEVEALKSLYRQTELKDISKDQEKMNQALLQTQIDQSEELRKLNHNLSEFLSWAVDEGEEEVEEKSKKKK